LDLSAFDWPQRMSARVEASRDDWGRSTLISFEPGRADARLAATPPSRAWV
jgi:hypothetical protein